MNLVINATSITSDGITGIERFALQISKELYLIEKNLEVFSTYNIPEMAIVAQSSKFLAAVNQIFGKYEYVLRAIWDQTFFRYHVSKSKPDIVFFPIQEGMLFPPVKQIVTVHDLHYLHFNQSISECSSEIGFFRKFFYHKKMLKVLSNSAAVIAVSESTRRDVIENFGVDPRKIHVIYNGYDESRFLVITEPDSVLERYNLKKQAFCLCIGSILRHKNFLRLVQAFAKQKSKTKLVIAGVCKDAGYLAEIMHAAATLGISDRVQYLGYVPDKDIPYLLSGAIALLMPSLHEGFGVPVIEAMACGTPVITSNCSAMPEVAGAAALYVDPFSTENIASGISSVLENKNLRQRMSSEGLVHCQKFRWSVSAAKLYDLFLMVDQDNNLYSNRSFTSNS